MAFVFKDSKKDGFPSLQNGIDGSVPTRSNGEQGAES